MTKQVALKISDDLYNTIMEYQTKQSITRSEAIVSLVTTGLLALGYREPSRLGSRGGNRRK